MPKVLSYICPFCGTEVAVGTNCSGCPKKSKKPQPKKKSWEQDSAHDGLGLPDDDFDYKGFVAREFGKAPHKMTGVKWYWWALAVVLLAGMIYGIFKA